MAAPVLLPSWIDSANRPDGSFPLNNLPCGVFSDGDAPRCGVAIGELILDLAACEARGLVAAEGTLARPAWNDFIALGPRAWAALRARLMALLGPDGPRDLPLIPMARAVLHLPIRVSEFTDFYASRHHAQTVGALFRDPQNALPPQWTHMPIGYNGRASSVVVSGTPIRRPMGQLRGDAGPVWAASVKLDLELELGAVVGLPTEQGCRITVDQAEEMIFGHVLLNDWSARDIQAWEYQPLGPFQGKAMATTIGAWIVTRAALEPFRCAGAPRDHAPLPYLAETRPGFHDIRMGWSLNGQVMARVDYAVMYWSQAQALAHHASSGCPMRVGDLLGSGTVSGPGREQMGALLEMTRDGRDPVRVNGTLRTFLEDGDEVALFAHAQGHGFRVGFGPCTGRILPAE